MTHVRPEAPSVELARDLAAAMDLDSRESFKTRDRDVPTPFHPLRVTRRRPTVTSARCVLPRVFWAPWSGAFALDPRWPRTVRGRCSTSTSATDSQRHVHPAESFDARGARPRLRGAARPSETNPRRATRVVRRLRTPRELRSSSFTSPSHRPFGWVRRTRAKTHPSGPRSRVPGSAPPNMRRCLPRAGRAHFL